MSDIADIENRIKKAGIVGAGKMGTGIFYYLLDFPYELVWVGRPGSDIEKLSRQFLKRIKRSVDAGIIDKGRYNLRTQTQITSDMNALRDCDLVIEAIPEDPDLKRELFLQLDKVIKPEAIFASNSSSINPSDMAPAGQRAGQFTGLHFFYPIALKNIAEFTVTRETTWETIAIVESFLGAINRRYIILNEKNCFMLNKIFLDFQNEAFLIVHSGQCSYRQMDQLVKKYIFPFGVFDFCDSVGLDTMLASIMNYIRDYPHKSYFSQFVEVLSGLVSRGKLGQKTQEGFYTYPLQEILDEEPKKAKMITDHLRQTWISSTKRFTGLAHVPIDDANHAIREYFDLSKGPFEH